MHAGKLFITALALLIVPVGPGVGQGSTAADPLSPAATMERVDGGVLEQGLLDKLEDGPRGIIVHFEDTVPANLAEIPGIQPSYTFESIPAAYVLADAAAVGTLSALDSVTFIEDAEKALAFHLDSATIASRAREVFDPTFTPPATIIDETDPTPTLPEGGTIDGAGVGIAVVDTGIDGTHPGLAAPGKLVANHLVTPTGVVEAGAYTETGTGHGTRLAGVAAGTGEASTGPDWRGAAPGASLYGLATSPAGTTLAPAMAFDWILTHGLDQDPEIRVVLNGWSCDDQACGEPDQAHLALAGQLAQAGFVVLFPVGNDAGEALVSRVSTEASLQVQGILGVGAHDDEEIGGRTDCTKSISSRGNALDPSTWPDLLAPGDDVWAPQALTIDPDTRVPVLERKAYTSTTGTSLAGAHLAGVVALLLQANPALDPAGIEHILEVTAHELGGADRDCVDYVRADPTNPWGTANFAAGHGLVDAVDAVQLALDWTGLPDPDDAPELEPIPAGFHGLDPVFTPDDALDGPLYLAGDDAFSEQAPTGTLPHARAFADGQTAVHATAPLAEAMTLSAAYVEAWIGTNAEWGPVKCSSTDFVAVVEAIDPAGDVTQLGRGADVNTEFVATGGPWLRELPVVFDEPVTLDTDDRMRLTLDIKDECIGTEDQWILYSDADATPSRLLLGQATQDIAPDSFESCQLLERADERGCSWIGGVRQAVPLRCDGTLDHYRVVWHGPPGSGAAITCPGAQAVCIVPGGPGDPWGTCEAVSATGKLGGWVMDACVYFTPDGQQVEGEGFCVFEP